MLSKVSLIFNKYMNATRTTIEAIYISGESTQWHWV
uniref:Uncharacterized protein n=1 Tax=Anguilla anguilla TaxID=7936 RepID=A0A0E9VC10_ANGAN